MAKFSWDKEQREAAKRDGNSLYAFAASDKRGLFQTYGPIHPERLKQIESLILPLITDPKVRMSAPSSDKAKKKAKATN